MSDPLFSPGEPPRSWRPLRLRLNDVPGLFSEGPEPQTPELTKTPWPNVDAATLRLRLRWPELLAQITDRTRTLWLGDVKA